MNQVAVSNGQVPANIVEGVVMRGDLSRLSDEQRLSYYHAVCRSVGLNPITKPFEYITLNNKLTLYALRNCTDQLRQIHKISVSDMTETERDGVYIVTCKVADTHGRTDMAKGAVNIASLKGEALANALMKAETKAKRRATLSICGLSLLDETEIEDIPAAAKQRPNPHVSRAEDMVDIPPDDSEYWWPPATDDRKVLVARQREIANEINKEMYAIESAARLRIWKSKTEEKAKDIKPEWLKMLSGKYKEHLLSLEQAEEHIDQQTGEVVAT